MTPNDRQLDALREVANIGAGHAATALSKLVGGRKVEIEVAQARLVDASELPAVDAEPARPMVAAMLEILGDVTGNLVLLVPEEAARALCQTLLGSPSDTLDDPCRDAFAETANILASACLSAMGQLLRLKLFPSVPRVVQGDAAALGQQVVALSSQVEGVALVLETRFFSPPITGNIYLLPTAEGVHPLLERLGV